jgi:hypothetical protein
MEKDKEKES